MERLGALAVLLLAVALGVSRGPQPTHDTGFRAERALASLHAALGPLTPRPPGSPGHVRAREGLARALTELGLDPVVEEAMQCHAHRCAVVRNVRAHISGPEDDVVWLVAHYDTVPASPGLTDDGAGMAVLLEAARLGRAASPARGLGVVFTDGEELGLLGARALDTTGVHAVVNLDARGSTGRAWMFRSTGLEALAATLPHPPAMSALGERLFSWLGHDTDMSVFEGAGVPAADLALVADPRGYHTDQDLFLDPDALQDLGDKAVGLWLALAREPLPAERAITWSVGPFTPRWPRWAALPLMLAALVLVRRAGLRDAGLLALVCGVALVLAATLQGLVFALGLSLAPGWLLLSMALALAAVALPLCARAHATWLGLGLFGLALTALIPEVSPLFVLPVAWAGLVQRLGLGPERLRAALAAAPGIVLWTDGTHLSTLALGVSPLTLIAPLLPLTWMAAPLLVRPLPWRRPALGAALALGLALVWPTPGERTVVHRQQQGQAYWLVTGERPDGFDRLAHRDGEPVLGTWAAPAEPRDEPDPTGVLTGKTLTVQSQRGATWLGVRLPRSTRVWLGAQEIVHTGWIEVHGSTRATLTLESTAGVSVFDVVPLADPPLSDLAPRRDGHRSVRLSRVTQ